MLFSGDFTPIITQTHEQLRDKRELCAGLRPGGPRCRTWLADNLHFGSVNTDALLLGDPFKEFITACAIGQEVRLEPRLRPTDPLPLGTSTHIKIRDVGGTFSVSFNEMVQCTTGFTGQALPARTDYTSVTCAACSKTDELATQSESYSACNWCGCTLLSFRVWAPLPQASTCKRRHM